MRNFPASRGWIICENYFSVLELPKQSQNNEKFYTTNNGGYSSIANTDVSLLKIGKDSSDSSLTLKLEGRLDSTTAPVLEAELKGGLNDITDLVFDLSALEFISSAGLRFLLLAQKAMKKQGTMIIRHPIQDVINVFEITGFKRIFNIEK